MKNTVLVDANVVIEYLKTGKGTLPVAYETYNLVISVVTITEILASKTFEDDNLNKEVREFIDKYFIVVDLNRDIAEKTGEIIRKYELNLSASIVAATCIIGEYDLLTNNEEEFKNIEGLSILKL